MSGIRKKDYRRFSMNMAVTAMEYDRLQGWLTIASAIETESLDQLEWHRRYCVLAKDERRLYFYNDTESVLMSNPLSPVRFTFAGEESQDGQCMSTRKNALTLLDPNYVALPPGNTGFQRGTRQTRSFRDKVRSSLQKSVKKNVRDENRLGGGSMRVGRSKSFGKMDRLMEPTSTVPGMKLGSSLENLHHVGGSGATDSGYYPNLGDHGTMLDLATKGLLSINPVHQSISPRHSCFRIITETDVVYASCGSQEELEKWVTSLTECQRPNRNHLRRVDSQLSLWVLEARNLQPKKRYYCEISLNGVLYARTCCKLMNDILFWGEPFIFEDLPLLGSVMIKLYRENYNKKKKERSDTDLGKIEIPALVLDNGQLHEQWYQVTTYSTPSVKSGSSAKLSDMPSVRIKLHYKMVSIMPLKTYDEFLHYLRTDYGTMCEVLEPLIPTKAKDEIAQTLVRILQIEGKAKEFLCDIIMTEVQSVENENLIFRGNTFATKAVDTYMKMVGQTYLHSTLTSFVHTLMDQFSEEDCEVDTMKLPPSSNLPQNQANLTALVERAWGDILKSFNKFPTDLRVTLNSIRQRFGPEREDACFKLISGSIFLRFFCPAILSPSLFNICQEYPDEKMARKLTLVAKVIQNLANFTRFGVKEEYMCFMNDFLSKEVKNMKQFIDRISSPHVGDQIVPWGPQIIDVAREASIMHTSLSNLLASLELPEVAAKRIEHLPILLRDIQLAGEEEASDPFTSTFEALRVMKTTISKFNVVSVDQEHSESSSEYTTPAQSQTTSPTREESPPTFAISEPSLDNLLSLGMTQDQNVSPSSSPTQGGISSLATHSMIARRKKTQTLPNSSRVVSEGNQSPDLRRLSDSALQRFGVRQMKAVSDSHLQHAPPIKVLDPLSIDEHIESAELRLENVRLLEEVERLKLRLKTQSEAAEKEKESLRRECSRAEDQRKKTEHDLKTLRESRGKILRGLNTQTEIALVQLKRDFESMRKQLLAKDEIISVQERKIASLIEANSTLRSGLQDLVTLPKAEGSDSEDSEEQQSLKKREGGGRGGGGKGRGRGGYMQHPPPVQQPPVNAGTRNSGGSVINGHPVSPGHSADLFRIISQLDSGKFEQS